MESAVLALNELHHEHADTVGFLETVDVSDVRMVQRGQGPGLALKPRDPLRVGGERIGQDLDRDGACREVGAVLFHELVVKPRNEQSRNAIRLS